MLCGIDFNALFYTPAKKQKKKSASSPPFGRKTYGFLFLVAFSLHIEARTFLYPFFGFYRPIAVGFYRPIAVQVRAEIPVTCYYIDGELLLQCRYQPFKGLLLFCCAGVLGIALDVEPALVADAYAAFVVALAVGSYPFHRTHIAYLSRTTDIKVIPASVETTLTVHLDKISRLEPFAFRRSRAVYDNCVKHISSLPPPFPLSLKPPVKIQRRHFRILTIIFLNFNMGFKFLSS